MESRNSEGRGEERITTGAQRTQEEENENMKV